MHLTGEAQVEWGTNWRKHNGTETREINNGSTLARDACRQSLAHIQQAIQSTAAAQLKRMKKKSSKCSTVDGWWWISVPWKKKTQKTPEKSLSTETGTKWLCQTGNSRMCCGAWHHLWSHWICHLLWQCPDSILITDKALTANLTRGFRRRKKKLHLLGRKWQYFFAVVKKVCWLCWKYSACQFHPLFISQSLPHLLIPTRIRAPAHPASTSRLGSTLDEGVGNRNPHPPPLCPLARGEDRWAGLEGRTMCLTPLPLWPPFLCPPAMAVGAAVTVALRGKCSLSAFVCLSVCLSVSLSLSLFLSLTVLHTHTQGRIS